MVSDKTIHSAFRICKAINNPLEKLFYFHYLPNYTLALKSLTCIIYDLTYLLCFLRFNRQEAQKCLCGSENCRGVIGKQKKQREGKDTTPKRRGSIGEKRRKESFADITVRNCNSSSVLGVMIYVIF